MRGEQLARLKGLPELQRDPRYGQRAWELAEEISRRFDAPVDLRLLYQRDELYSVSVR